MSIPKNPHDAIALDPWAYEFEQALKKNASNYVAPEIRKALAEVSPPLNNMGDKLPFTPYFFPHREKIGDSVVQKTKIDWLGFTCLQDIEAVRLALQIFFPGCLISRSAKGMRGYPLSDCIMLNGEQLGLIGHGAKHGRVFVSLPGTGCSMWNAEQLDLVYETLVVLEARLSRLDICLDFYNGERTFDHATWCFERGDFKRRDGAEQPYTKVVDASIGDKNMGRTRYVGKRDGAVMARIYEKGLEVFANMPSVYKTLSESREVEYVNSGNTVPYADTWLRVEIEFKMVIKDRLLPLEMIRDRDDYFAGAFPYCASALAYANPVRPRSLKTEKEICLIKKIAAARKSYGSLVNSLVALGYSDADIREVLDNGKEDKKLRAAGVLSMLEKSVDQWKLNNPDWDIPCFNR